MNNAIFEKLSEFYDNEIPGYIRDAGKSFMIINHGHDWDESIKPRKITMDDTLEYYRSQAGSMSGIRSIAGFSSDWRGIDNLASETLEWFKFINVDGLRSHSRHYGMEARF